MKTFVVISFYYGGVLDIYIRKGKSPAQVADEEEDNYNRPVVIELGRFRKAFDKALMKYSTEDK
jgi:hypothetical protein